MELMTIQQQQDQAQHGIQLTPEQLEEQLKAVDDAFEEYHEDQRQKYTEL
jgi:hypothetical protein